MVITRQDALGLILTSPVTVIRVIRVTYKVFKGYQDYHISVVITTQDTLGLRGRLGLSQGMIRVIRVIRVTTSHEAYIIKDLRKISIFLIAERFNRACVDHPTPS